MSRGLWLLLVGLAASIGSLFSFVERHQVGTSTCYPHIRGVAFIPPASHYMGTYAGAWAVDISYPSP